MEDRRIQKLLARRAHRFAGEDSHIGAPMDARLSNSTVVFFVCVVVGLVVVLFSFLSRWVLFVVSP